MSEKSLPTLASELWDLVRAYAKQETVEPLKGLVRYIGFGVGGGVFLSVGLVLLALGGLRGLQTLDTFDDNLSWAPYGIVVAAAMVLVALLLSRTGKRKAAH